MEFLARAKLTSSGIFMELAIGAKDPEIGEDEVLSSPWKIIQIWNQKKLWGPKEQGKEKDMSLDRFPQDKYCCHYKCDDDDASK